jgi:hypothetical protein
VRLLLVSEGALDVGTSGRGGPANEEGDERRGAVSVLVRRVLAEKFGRDIADHEIERAVLPRVHAQSDQVSGYPRKVMLAIKEAAARRCTSVAIVVDRDRTPGGSRLAQLREGRALSEGSGEPLAQGTALGVAVETVEAWLLADEKALNDALGLAPPTPAIAGPEELDGGPKTESHPKNVFRKLVKRGTSAGEPYDGVAERVRLELLERRCKLGFAPFAEEVRERCR